MLTGKALNDFIDWLWQSKFNKEDYKEYEDFLNNQKPSHTQADIIDWFDSVNIIIAPYIERTGKTEWMWGGCIYHNYFGNFYDIENKSSRTEAISESIKKANEIYNTTH